MLSPFPSLRRFDVIQILLIACCALLGPALTIAQTPDVPVEFLRDRGVGGFDSGGPREGRLFTKRHGSPASGMALAVNPGEVIEFALAQASRSSRVFWSPARRDGGTLSWEDTVEWSLPGGQLSRSSAGEYRLMAPERPGNFRFTLGLTTTIRSSGQADSQPQSKLLDLMFLVKAPFDRQGDGAIGGYPIGVYPNEAGRGAPHVVQQHQGLYQPPAGFIQVTPEVERLFVSAHYRLGDFSPPYERGRPHYIALDPRLLEFLERATETLSVELAVRSSSQSPLRVIAAFFSPNYLARLRSQGVRLADFTRYQYGDAAAVIWDADSDGMMDDLDNDGLVNLQDAAILAEHLDEVQRRMAKFGGIGAASAPKIPNLPRTPYVDIDMRGIQTRW